MENIMLTEDKQQIKIVDFGLSNTWSVDSPLRTHCGSPEYAAPELFMVGYQYGPEVDLWSLGVILYGMVIGRLPFVSSRDDVMTSQERRQRLLAQINRGLTSNHKKNLSVFSGDFRSLISRLLVPTPSKRITTKNLIFHPWITHQQKKLVRISPMGKLDSYWQSIIFKELENILDIDERDLTFQISAHPYGDVSGMYNIRVHQHLLQELDGDGVTYTPKTLTPSSYNAIKCMTIRAQTAKTRFSEISENSSQQTLQIPYSAREASYRRAIKDLENEYLHKSSERNRYKNSCSRTFTNSQFQQSEKKEHNTRKAEGDSTLEDFYIPCPLHTRYSTRQQPITAPPTHDQLRVVGSKGVTRPFNWRPATNHSEKRTSNLTGSRPATAVNRDQVKSDPLSLESTAYTGPVHTAKRAQRRLSGLTVVNSKSVPSTPLNNDVKQDISKKQRDRSKERIRAYGRRKADASGDKGSSCTTTDSHGKKLDSELKNVNPIARSIADYVKNIKKDSSSPINKLKKIIDHDKLSPPLKDSSKKERTLKKQIHIKY